jgi:hypothetical protein
VEIKIIGDTNIFALELSSWTEGSPSPMGDCQLWISGCRLSSADSGSFYDSVLDSLRAIIDKPEDVDSLPVEIDERASFVDFMFDSDAMTKHGFLVVEGFDDYLKIFYKRAGFTTFVFCHYPPVCYRADEIKDKQTLEIEISLIDRNLYICNVDNSEIELVAEEFLVFLERIRGPEIMGR